MSSAGPALRCICLAGPTGSGKTAAAIAFAERHAVPVEIVSVDSALVYRGMDIGTAKPGVDERRRVPHHLIDLIDPAEHYSAARFVAEATRCIDAIGARGALPLLVGGTMLYFRALFDGIDEMPASDPAVRATIDAQAQRLGWPALHAELAQVDPVTAERLAPADSQRIQRALEVFRISGRPLSAHHRRNGQPRPPAPPLVSLEPLDRGWLHARLAQRFQLMLDAGLLDEVGALRRRGDLHPDLPALRCVGYRQAWQALDATGDAPLEGAARFALVERATAATRQLAKRQLTWLRAMPQREVVACDGPTAQADAIAALQRAAAALDAVPG